MENLRFVVLLVCVVAFVACVIGGLLILFERWTPRNKSTRPFLVAGVLASAVAAATPQGGNLFGVPAQAPDKDKKPPVEAGSGAPKESATPGRAKEEDSGAPPEIAQEKREGTKDAGSDVKTAEVQPEAGVAAWVGANLPTRPVLPNETDGTYPPCAIALRNKDISDIKKEDAHACYWKVDRFNTTTMLTYQTERSAYIEKIDSLSRMQASPEVLAFLRQELASFTDSEGKDFIAFVALSNLYLSDLRRLARLKS